MEFGTFKYKNYFGAGLLPAVAILKRGGEFKTNSLHRYAVLAFLYLQVPLYGAGLLPAVAILKRWGLKTNSLHRYAVIAFLYLQVPLYGAGLLPAVAILKRGGEFKTNSLHRYAVLDFLSIYHIESKLSCGICIKKSRTNVLQTIGFGSGGRIRTYDLWVMSPTSYHCSTPH